MNESKIFRQSVRWADGTFDAKRTCDECGLDTCAYPVHKDYYAEIVTTKTYWNWMEENEENENA
jgi:hypothetical protein